MPTKLDFIPLNKSKGAAVNLSKFSQARGLGINEWTEEFMDTIYKMNTEATEDDGPHGPSPAGR